NYVQQVFGEAVAAACLLSATLKFKGKLVLQINGQASGKQSDGAAYLLLIQVTSAGTLRGLVRWQKEKQTALEQAKSLTSLFGEKAQLVITIDPTDQSERYQGVTALTGDCLADALDDYFIRSEQLKTRVYLSANATSAAGLLLQRLPNEADDEDGWQRVQQLANTVQGAELLELSNETLLHRLFHEEQVRLFEPKPFTYQCTCSLQKVTDMVRSLGQAEAEAMLAEQDNISVTCEFCNTHYALDKIDVHQLFLPHEPLNHANQQTTVH
ncbi:MAG TPA: Hsp33 family molecular chaperone HslO, partial [Thiothrix sp.]|nr:Hsp33 family molecular chaperone HslO [Thiothrix sp.]